MKFPYRELDHYLTTEPPTERKCACQWCMGNEDEPVCDHLRVEVERDEDGLPQAYCLCCGEHL